MQNQQKLVWEKPSVMPLDVALTAGGALGPPNEPFTRSS